MVGFQWDISTGRVTRLGDVPAGATLGAEYTLQDVADRIHPDDRPAWQARLDAALAGTDEFFMSEHRTRGDDGRWRWFLVHGRIERARDGTPLSMLGLGIDVTPQRELQEALRESDRRKDEFLATLAHELRNPLAPLRNGLEALEMDESLAPTARRIHEMMGRQVDQMVHLVDDLLEVSRITRGQVELRRRIVPLRTIVEGAVETSRPLVDAGRHRLELDLPDAPLSLDADPVRLSQVLSNLLNNAARYTPPGGRIELTARREDDLVAVTVRDTGVGISSEVLPHVFDMFVRGDGSQAGGLGIGLALVHALVEMHGGRVEAHSKGPGLGSEFVVRLPLATSERAAEAERGDEPSPDAMPRLRIVAVDDNRDAVDTLALLLGRLGAAVTVAYDGESALEAIRAERPRLALVDLGMPVVDGFELARRVREEPALDDVALVALSGWGLEPDRKRSRAAGFDHHLVKPVDVDALRALLASLA
jgi:signal transduction histidine kinase/CheY-like chemotaxis protein